MKTSASSHIRPYEAEELLRRLGERVSVARRARQLTAADLAAKAGISLRTLASIERGAPTVQIGYWMSVLWALDILSSFESLARLGRGEESSALLEDQLPKRVRYRRQRKADKEQP